LLLYAQMLMRGTASAALTAAMMRRSPSAVSGFHSD
jgi:hypothetical protein